MRQFAASTHPGHKRKNNEDCFEAAPELSLWLVADGVGGHASGEVASAIVGATLRECVGNGETLTQAIYKCHEAVLAEIRTRSVINDMGSTVVAVHLDEQGYEIAWVGDSRAYLWDGDLRQVTRDHNPVSELLTRGIITTEEAAVHPERHVLTQSLGVSENMQLEPGFVHGPLRDTQQILLCSDGLTDELPDAAIRRLMAANRTPQAQVDALVEAALAAGGRDNVTVVVVGTGQAEPSGNPVDGREITRESDVLATAAGDKPPGSSPLLWTAALTLLLAAAWWWL